MPGTNLRVYVLWMHVTASDRQPPNSIVLGQFTDRRVAQYWDPYRLLSKTMLREYPADTAIAMADTTGGGPPVIWDFVAMWRPGTRWNERLPMPDFAGHPIADLMEPYRERLEELLRLTASRRSP